MTFSMRPCHSLSRQVLCQLVAIFAEDRLFFQVFKLENEKKQNYLRRGQNEARAFQRAHPIDVP